MKHINDKLKKPATMRDVARLAGVSQPTVSRVLSQSDTSIPVSDETREKIMAAVEALGYHPNVLARSLRTQKTQMIAVMIADISNSFYHPIARAVHDVARHHDYDTLIADSDHIYENEKQFLEAVTRRPVDGVIMVPIHITMAELDRFIAKTNTPMSILGDHIHHPQIDIVYVDDERATYDGVRWLIEERGHRRLGYIGVTDDLPPGPRRLHGFMRALNDCGVTEAPYVTTDGDFTMESGVQTAKRLIADGRLPSALFVCNDLMAIGMILTLQDHGYRIPDDVAVMGFDNIPEATIVRPPLTTIAQDPYDLGEKLAHALFARIKSPLMPQVVQTSSRTLIIRESA